MIGDHVDDALRRAFVWNDLEPEAGLHGKRLRHHLARARQTRRTVSKRSRASFRLGDEILERLHVALGAHDEQDRRARDIGDMGQILHRIIADLRIDERRDDGERQRADDEVVAVGFRIRHGLHADHAARPGTRFNVELLLERDREMIGDDAGQDVGGSAGRKGVDDAHRSRRPFICRRRKARKDEAAGKSEERGAKTSHGSSSRLLANRNRQQSKAKF